MLEIDVSGWTRLVAACLYPVEQDLIVNTRSEKMDKIRKMILDIGYVESGAKREIRFVPEIAAAECKDCKECFPLCPTLSRLRKNGYVKIKIADQATDHRGRPRIYYTLTPAGKAKLQAIQSLNKVMWANVPDVK